MKELGSVLSRCGKDDPAASKMDAWTATTSNAASLSSPLYSRGPDLSEEEGHLFEQLRGESPVVEIANVLTEC